ncbi:response regulator [Spirulina subsalsa FACHB-351]|uniref:Response regulator n=1 Tax=Spirulina subsalsa FACHB-351 TaxID=234711 RepID=A0ABT3LBH0_9CYAN|nr:response regulator [Spirulina subsalsa]MCW6038855.1 response regulator [Spirulina subsalsa FACHB-351]
MGNRKILIIDDEEDIREVAKLSLEIGQDWDVVAASSGSEGLALCKTLCSGTDEQPPDAILLDVMMPDMDGPTTWHKLQEDPLTAKIPVIFLTAKVQAAEQRYYAQLGVNAVLTKPFDPVTLGDFIAKVLNW